MINAILHVRRIASIVSACLSAFLLSGLASPPVQALPTACSKITIQGEVSSGQAWSAPLGQGWVLRLVPVQPGDKYSGWDIVLNRTPGDRIEPAGFPDAVFLATPPYGSLNEREIATTYGLRAQDAIGWNPRTFRFLLDPLAFHAGQQLYLSSHGAADPKTSASLLDLIHSASQGELRIVDARAVPGIADPASYAQNWAIAAARTPYQAVAPIGGQPTPRGALLWMRFTLALWPPPGWRAPAGWTAVSAPCPLTSPAH
ncbi:hypothetical protein [Terracidiphilus gabretensis]|uniref:hypothetical protein n=1 Tax=Terracidiphilus gabretensis TaxID=1577687 RepID=UPI00071C183B|nr:hypothetical protein [Terracidiphilus gabretensis]